MSDVASLGFAIDSGQVVAATKNLDGMVAASARAEGAAKKLSGASNDNAQAHKQAANEAQRAAAQHSSATRVVERHTESIRTQRMQIRALAEAFGNSGSEMAELINRSGLLFIATRHVSVGAIALVVTIGTLVLAIRSSVAAFSELEKQQARVGNALAATRGASGQTAESIERLNRHIAESGTQSIENVRAASIELLKFRSIGGETFEHVMKTAADLAAGLGGDLKSSVQAVAKSLQEPAKASEVFEAIGLRLSVSQQRLATDLVNAGKIAQAQAVIMKVWQDQVGGGNAKAADTLSASWKRLEEQGATLLEQWGEQIAKGSDLKRIIDSIATAAEHMQQSKTAGTIVSAIGAYLTGERFQQPSPKSTVALPGQGTFNQRFDTSAIEEAARGVKQLAAVMKDAAEKIAAVSAALKEEAKFAGLSAVEQDTLRRAIAAGVEGDKAKTASIRALVVALHALDFVKQTTDALIEQTSAFRIQSATIGMAAGKAAEYKVIEEARTRAIIQGLPAETAITKAVLAKAAALGIAAQKAAEDKAASDATFARQTVFLNETEQQIAQVQFALHGNAWKQFMDDGLSASMRLTAALKQINQLGSDFASSLARDISAGVKPMDALANAAKGLSNSLIEIATKNLMQQAFGSLAGMNGVTSAAPLNQAAIALSAAFAQGTAAAAALEAAAVSLRTAMPAGGGNPLQANASSFDDRFSASFPSAISKAAQEGTEAGAKSGVQTGILKVGQEAAVKAGNSSGVPGVSGGLSNINAFGAVAALAVGLNAYKAGQSTASAGSGLLSGALGGALAGASLGGPIGALAGAAGGGLLGLLGANSGKKEQEKQAQLAAQQRITQFTVERQLSGIDTNSREGALLAFDIQASQARMQEQRDGGKAMAALEQNLAVRREAIIEDFGKRAAEAEQAAEDARLAKIDEFNRAFNSVKGLGFLNDIGDLFKQVDDFRKAGVGQGDLSEFLSLSAQKIVDDFNLTGDAFARLLDVFPQLSGVVHEATASLQAQIAAQTRVNDVAKTIVDYVNSLQAGPQSFLSPKNREIAAQASYYSQLALAQGGNLDAQAGITKYADDYIKAAQAFRGSSAAFQAILSQVKTQLLNLPAVQNATDPVVLALRDVVTAVNLVQGSSDTGNELLTVIQSYTNATQLNTASQIALQNSANALTTTTNSWLDQMRTLLDSIKQLNESQRDTTNEIKNAGQLSADRLDIILENMRRTTNNLASANRKQQTDFQIGAFAQGGVIPAYGLGYVSEHSANPRFIRAGSEPIPVFPGSPSSDNGSWSAVLAELRQLRAEVALSRRENSAVTLEGSSRIVAPLEEIASTSKQNSKAQRRAAAGRAKRS